MSKLIQPLFNGVPAFLAQKKRWIVWKAVQRTRTDGTTKIDKVPYSAKSRKKGGIDHSDEWVTFAQAYEAYALHGFDGVGFVFTGQDDLFGVDLDKCVLPDGSLKPFAETVMNTLQTYTEVSVSGTGLHIIGRGKLPGKGRTDHKEGIEVYCDGRFFTISGKCLKYSTVEERQKEIQVVYDRYWGGERFEGHKADKLVWDDTATVKELSSLPVTDYIKDLIASGTNLGDFDNDRSKALWHVTYDLVTAGVNKETILTILSDSRYVLAQAALDRRGGVASAREWLWVYTVGVVMQAVEEERKLFDEVEPPTEEKKVEKIPFEKNKHERNANLFRNHVIPVVRVNGRYLYYTGKYWKPAADEWIEGKVHRAMAGRDFPMSTINNTITTLKRFTTVDRFEQSKNIINFQNGAISLAGYETGEINMTLIPHDKKHQAIGIADYDYDPKADCPTFRQFLHDVTNGDQESINLFLEYLGMLMVPGLNKFQVALYLVGASGSGKSTFINVARMLIGETNTVGTSFSNLAGDHGLLVLQFATLGVIADAHQAETTKIGRVKETLLNIISGDPVTINPKGKDEFSTILPARFIMAANEPPRFSDEFGALMRRYLIVHFRKSFVGAEDFDLMGKLKGELPGIFNWVIREGLIPLMKRGRFVEPAASRSKRDEISMIQGSTSFFLKTFVKHTKDPDHRIEKSALYDYYLQYMNEINLKPVDNCRFSRRVKDEIPDIKDGRMLVTEGRGKAWLGIKVDTKKLADFDGEPPKN